MSWFLRLGLVLAACSLPFAANAQYAGSNSPNSTPHCDVAGVVVNSLTGESIPRAQVMIYGPEMRTTLADPDGHFSFEDVPQTGPVVLAGRKPGFSNRNRQISQVCSTSSNNGIKVSLDPTSAIVGRITDPEGEPVDDVPVRLGKYDFSDGHRRFASVGSATTDFDGRFRIPDLEPGSYLLLAGPTSSNSLVAAREVAPLSYYPGVPDRASATLLQVGPGARVEANMTVDEVPAFTISGRVVGGTAETRGVTVQLTNQAGDDVGTVIGGREQNHFTVVGVPGGTYRLHATAYEHEGVMFTGTTNITLARDLTNVQVPVAAPLTLRINVRAEGFDPEQPENAPYVSVRLLSTQDENREAVSTPEGNRIQRWVVKNVERGTYIAEVTPNSGGYVASARLSGVDILREPVTINSDQDPIEVTVRNDGAQLSGTVEAPSSTMIVALPSDGVLFPSRTGAYANSGTTTFQMTLAPGDYTVYAIAPNSGLDFANPKVMEKYASYAVHVSLSAREKKEIALKTIEVYR